MSTPLFPIAAGLLLLLAGLGLVGYLKIRHALSIWGAIGRTLDRSVRKVGLVSLAPAGGVAIWLMTHGIEPPASLVVGAAAGIGVWCAALGLLRMEGALLEPESEAIARQQQGLPAPSSTVGRIVAIGVGLVAIGVALYALSIVG